MRRDEVDFLTLGEAIGKRKQGAGVDPDRGILGGDFGMFAYGIEKGG